MNLKGKTHTNGEERKRRQEGRKEKKRKISQIKARREVPL